MSNPCNHIFVQSRVCRICFSNTLKLALSTVPKSPRACCICFSNTLKLDFGRFGSRAGVCRICFSNTLKLDLDEAKLMAVFVVFVLAIPSNLKPQIPFKRPGRKHR